MMASSTTRFYIVGDNGSNPEGTLPGTPWPEGAKPGGNMLRVLAAANLSLFLLGSGAALADDCSPHCDYWHYYGPYDFSYIRPGLVGYPICDQRGNCSPHLVYTYSGRQHGQFTITVRPIPKSTRNPHGGS
jgi:hypothetical protein